MSAKRATVRRIMESEGIGGLKKKYAAPGVGPYRAYPCPCPSDNCSSWLVDGPGLSAEQGMCTEEVAKRIEELLNG